MRWQCIHRRRALLDAGFVHWSRVDFVAGGVRRVLAVDYIKRVSWLCVVLIEAGWLLRWLQQLTEAVLLGNEILRKVRRLFRDLVG